MKKVLVVAVLLFVSFIATSADVASSHNDDGILTKSRKQQMDQQFTHFDGILGPFRAWQAANNDAKSNGIKGWPTLHLPHNKNPDGSKKQGDFFLHWHTPKHQPLPAATPGGKPINQHYQFGPAFKG